MSLTEALVRLAARAKETAPGTEISESFAEAMSLTDAVAFLHRNGHIKDRVLFRPRPDAAPVLYIGLGVHSEADSLAQKFPDSFVRLGHGSFEGGVRSGGRWIVPRVLIRVESEISTVSFVCDPDGVSFLFSIDTNFQAGDHVDRKFPVLTESVSQSREEFSASVDRALAAIAAGDMEKVVLSFSRNFRLDFGPDHPQSGDWGCLLLQGLLQTVSVKERYLFFMASETRSVLSFSPERLLRLDSSGGLLETEALAGTFGVAETGETEKLLREHSQVTSYVVRKLKEISDQPVRVSEREVLRLGSTINHWREKISAHFPAEGDLVAAVDALHPTPAVCGFPCAVARRFIAANEISDRGFYAAPCGLVSREISDLLVAIRCAQVDHKSGEISVRGGAGIVAGSEAAAEWEEINNKISAISDSACFERARGSGAGVGVQFSNMTQFSCFLLLEELRRQGISEVVMSPGSRSSPLVVAAQQAGLKLRVFLDERSSGFFALGRAKAGHVVPVLVTSGTAVANLLPAVAEASAAGVGLLVISGDREVFQTDAGENQTLVQQERLFSGVKNAISRCLQFPIHSHEQALGLLSDAALANFQVAILRRVFHLNVGIPYADVTPLASSREKRALVQKFLLDRDNAEAVPLQRWHDNKQPFTRHTSEFPEWFFSGKHLSGCLVVVGDLQGETVSAEILESLSEWEEVCVISDSLSGISGQSGLWPLLMASRVFREALADRVQLVVWLGGNLISKQLQAWLGSLPVPTVRVSGNLNNARIDPQFTTTVYCHMQVGNFIPRLRKLQSLSSDFRSLLDPAENACTEAVRAEISGRATLSEPGVAALVGAHWSHAVFLGAGMACRDFNSFARLEIPQKPAAVFMNRGANGIDGLLASACGASDDKPLLLLLGDCSCLYDLSSLAAIGNFPQVKVVVLNNDGGGIFRFLRDERNSLVSSGNFKELWETGHGINLASVARSLGIAAVRVSETSEFVEALAETSDAQFVECVVPDSDANVRMHKEISDSVARAVDRAILGPSDDELEHIWIRRDVRSEFSIVFLHGWLGGAADWELVARKLRVDGNLLAVEISSKEDTPSLFCHRLHRLLSGNSSKIFLVGYSMGGRLAMHYASLFPEEISGLVLLSTVPAAEASVNRDTLAKKIQTCPPTDFLQYWYSEIPIFASLADRYPQVVDRKFDSEISVAQLRNFAGTRVCSPGKILGVVVGILDAKYLRLARQSGLEVAAVAGAGHALLLETEFSAQTAGHVENFLVKGGVPRRKSVSESGMFRLVSFRVEDFEVALEETSESLLRTNRASDTRRGFRVFTAGVFEVDGRRMAVRGGGEMPEPIRGEGSLVDLRMATCEYLRSLTDKQLDFISDRVEIVDALQAAAPGRHVAFLIEQIALTSLAQTFPGFPLTAVIQAYLEFVSEREISGIPGTVRLNSLEKYVSPQVPLKLKVGNDPGADAARIVEICARTPGLRLRLDANQQWTSDQALRFARLLSVEALQAIEYVEEPVNKPKRSKLKLMARNPVWRGIAIALDESIASKQSFWSELAENPEFILVLKPFLFSLAQTADLLLSENTVVSTTFESGFGLCFLVSLVAALGKRASQFHGLFPHPKMRDPYTLAYSLVLEGGSVKLSKAETLLRRFLDQA